MLLLHDNGPKVDAFLSLTTFGYDTVTVIMCITVIVIILLDVVRLHPYDTHHTYHDAIITTSSSPFQCRVDSPKLKPQNSRL